MRAHALGDVRLGVVEQRRDVVLGGAPPAALVVDEPRLAAAQHDVPGLKVAVEEVAGVRREQMPHEPVEVVLQALLVERNVGELEEVVLEVVEIPQHGLLIERRSRVGDAEVDHAPALDLEAGQEVHDPLVDVNHRARELPALRLARGGERLEQGGVAQILLEPEAAALVRREDLGDRQADAAERAREREERAVLVGIGAVRSDHGRRGRSCHPVVAALRPVGRQAGDLRRRAAEGTDEECDEGVVHGCRIPKTGRAS